MGLLESILKQLFDDRLIEENKTEFKNLLKNSKYVR